MSHINLSLHSTVDDILENKKTDLQHYLRRRNCKVTGTKRELAERVHKVNKESPLFDDEHKGTGDSNSKTHNGPRSININDIPDFSALSSGWSGDKELLPRLSHINIEDYLINSSHRTQDEAKMECYRQFVRGYNFFKEGYIHKVMTNMIDPNSPLCYVRSKCYPSMKQGTYMQWILMEKTEPHPIKKAYCSCPAGLGEGCTHIAGLLFALEKQRGDSETLIECTSKPCEWNRPNKRKLPAKPVEDIPFKKIRHRINIGASCSPKVSNGASGSTMDSKSFHDALCSKLNGDAVLFDLIKMDNQNNVDVCSDINVSCYEEISTTAGTDISYKACRYIYLADTIKRENIDEAAFVELFSNTHVPSDVIHAIETRTRGQHLNQAWHAARRARITASNFHSIKNRKKVCVKNLVSRLMCAKRTDSETTSESLRWGHKYEPIAKKRYAAQMKLHHKRDIKIRDCGLFLHPQCSYLGASPDGLVFDGECSYLMEVKCPFKWRKKSVREACSDNDFYCALSEKGVVSLKKTHSYYTQIQGQMGICNMERCDFVVYTERDLAVIQVEFDQIFWDSLMTKLNKFYMDYMLPALMEM